MTAVHDRNLVLHYHFFKCAGTSVERSLEHSFGDRLARFDRDVPFGKIFADDVRAFVLENPSIVALTSHQMKMPLPHIPGVEVLPIVFLRHPLDRILSVYRFDRRRGPVTPDAVVAGAHDFAGYVRTQLERRRQVENFHVMHLTDAWDTSTGRALPIGRAGHLERALAVLESLPCVGVVERYEESSAAFGHDYGHRLEGLHLGGAAENVDPERASSLEGRLADLRSMLGDDLHETLVAANAEDFVLYEAANRKLDVLTMELVQE